MHSKIAQAEQGTPRPIEYCARNSITHNGPVTEPEGPLVCVPYCQRPACQDFAHYSYPLLSRIHLPPGAGEGVTVRREAGLAHVFTRRPFVRPIGSLDPPNRTGVVPNLLLFFAHFVCKRGGLKLGEEKSCGKHKDSS